MSNVKSSVPAELSTEGTIGSPFKKHRASLPGFDDGVRKSLGSALMSAQKERGNSDSNVPTSSASTGLESKMLEDEDEL
jgi:hypothetical protein